jgi:hypothetical protein
MDDRGERTWLPSDGSFRRQNGARQTEQPGVIMGSTNTAQEHQSPLKSISDKKAY